jgi:hypothetical protein
MFPSILAAAERLRGPAHFPVAYHIAFVMINRRHVFATKV